jgi:hypothetical protein
MSSVHAFHLALVVDWSRAPSIRSCVMGLSFLVSHPGLLVVGLLILGSGCPSAPIGVACQSNVNCPADLVCDRDCRCQVDSMTAGRCGTTADGGAAAGSAAGGGTAGGAAGGGSGGGPSDDGGSGGTPDAGRRVPYGEPCGPTDLCDAPFSCVGLRTFPSVPGVCSTTCVQGQRCPNGFVCTRTGDFSDLRCLRPCRTGGTECGASTACDRSGAFVAGNGACVPRCSTRSDCANSEALCVNGVCCGWERYAACATGSPCKTPFSAVNGLCEPP